MVYSILKICDEIDYFFLNWNSIFFPLENGILKSSDQRAKYALQVQSNEKNKILNEIFGSLNKQMPFVFFVSKRSDIAIFRFSDFPDININAMSNNTQIFILDNKKKARENATNIIGKKNTTNGNDGQTKKVVRSMRKKKIVKNAQNLHYFFVFISISGVCYFVLRKYTGNDVNTPSMSSSKTYWISISEFRKTRIVKIFTTTEPRKKWSQIKETHTAKSAIEWEDRKRKRKFIEIRNWNWIEIEQYKNWNCVCVHWKRTVILIVRIYRRCVVYMQTERTQTYIDIFYCHQCRDQRSNNRKMQNGEK